ncbi:hypothetical protein KSP40_PGU014261 [Platanthera guangdongensis]|uniref:Uncharacterized protein n=1 Tax=Platanthera guangdongensis TaxID=2320717 RepID=A0ABR2LID3_9ASPA
MIWMEEKSHGSSSDQKSRSCTETESALHTTGSPVSSQSSKNPSTRIRFLDVFVRSHMKNKGTRDILPRAATIHWRKCVHKQFNSRGGGGGHIIPEIEADQLFYSRVFVQSPGSKHRPNKGEIIAFVNLLRL